MAAENKEQFCTKAFKRDICQASAIILGIIICVTGLGWILLPSIWLHSVPDGTDFGQGTIKEEFINSEITIINQGDGQIIYCIKEFSVEDNKLTHNNKVVLMTYKRHSLYYFYVGEHSIIELEHDCSDCGSATTKCLV